MQKKLRLTQVSLNLCSIMSTNLLPIDLPHGLKHKLAEICAMVKADPSLQNLSEKSSQMLLDGVQARHDEKKLGAHPSNKSAAQDYQHVVMSINSEVSNLSSYFILNISRSLFLD